MWRTMEKSKNKTIGDFGEKQAQKYLRKNKYKIICTNYRHKYGEIDIYAEKAVKISEQCLSNYILKYTFFDKKCSV